MRNMLAILNRHGLFVFPVLAFVFAAIAGLIGTGHGFHNLFRDHPGEVYCSTAANPAEHCPAFWENDWRAMSAPKLVSQIFGRGLVTSINFQNGGFGTTLIGLLWTILILIYWQEQVPPKTHPINFAGSVLWPGVCVLVLFAIVIPVQIAIGDSINDKPFEGRATGFHIWGLIQTLAGAALGLAVVYSVLRATISLSRRVRYPQIATVSAVSAVIILFFWFVMPLMPGSAVFLFMSMLTLLYAGWIFLPKKAQFGVIALLATVIFWGQGVILKHNFAALADYNTDKLKRPMLVDLDDIMRAPDAPTTLDDPVEHLNQWIKHYQLKSGTGQKPVFVAVATSGGGYRATYWTALVLDRLAEVFPPAPGKPGIADNIQLFTGASGGMVAAAYFDAGRTASIPDTPQLGLVAAIDRDIIWQYRKPASWRERMENKFRNARRDSLTPVIKKWLRHDVPGAFWPHAFETDRGTALEDQWPTLQNYSFANLRHGEQQGWRPSIIFSPLMIDSGRPLLISNLDLSHIAQSDARAVEFFRLFPDVQDKLTLATATRMSASFPYIAPASEVATNPGDRIVDAGYYDNDGIGLAAAYLSIPKVTEWIKANTAGVILLRINAFDPQTSQDRGGADCKSSDPGPSIRDRIAEISQFAEWFNDHWAHSWHWLWSPIEGAYVARQTAGRFANGQRNEQLQALYGKSFSSEEFAFDGNAAESWLLPEGELRDLRNCVVIHERVFQRLKAFWQQRELLSQKQP